MKIILKTFLASIILSFPCFALELSIVDSLGNIRHVADVSGPSTIRLTISSNTGKALDGASIVITRQDQNENNLASTNDKTRKSEVVAGIAEFNEVTPGQWVISSNSDSLVIAEINILDPNAMMAQADLATTGAAGGGVSGAAIAGAVIAIGGITTAIATEAGEEDDDEPSPFS
jgi:hypothetical protein